MTPDHSHAFVEQPRICFLSYRPSMGGVNTYQAYSIGYLLRKHCRILLVDEHPDNTLSRLGQESEQVEVMRTPVWSDPNAATEGLARLRSQPPQVVVLDNVGLLIKHFRLLQRLHRHGDTRVVLTLHSGMLTMTARRRVLELAGSLAALTVGEIVYVSRFTRAYWHGRYPWMRLRPNRVVPNGISLPVRVSARTPGSILKIGFVGRMMAEKGADLFGEVARLAHDRDLPFEFHAFGDGPLLNRLRSQYRGLVRWHGLANDIERIYSAIDLLLITSPVENCPYSLLEAKAVGVPTVAPRVGGIPEILTDGEDGMLAEEHSSAAICEALLRAHASYARLSQGALERRLCYDVNTLAEAMWAPYLHTTSQSKELLPCESSSMG